MAKVFWRNVREGRRKAALADLESIAGQEIDAALKKVERALIASHYRVVEDWDTDVDFAKRRYVRPDSITIYVFPTGDNKDIWTFVDKGTKPHPIVPKRAKFLRFQWGGPGSYTPKTLPKPARTVIGGGTVRGPVVYRKRVKHPGSEGRDFSGQIARDGEPYYKREMENAFRRAARRVEE